MPRPPFVLQVLGTPALHGPDGEVVTIRTKKHFALLLYLALEPQTHRREKLGELLWPGVTTSEARHSLATGLSVLRGKLGREYLATGRDTVRLLPGCLEIDLDRLARGEIHSTETTEALAVAPLLHEFEVADAGPWNHWREGLAAKWQPAIREALLARIDRSRRQGNTRAMEVLADALLQLDDLSEDGIRAKMESRAFAGDRLTALQIYETWRVNLADELGAQPSELVAGMALRLRRRGWERTSGEHIPAVRTDQWKDRPFIGRAKEYEVLYEGWEGCQRGAARHVLITGESGVGKSTLVERLTTAAGLQGAVTARVQCHEVEKEIPYGAIGGLIGQLLDLQGAAATAPEWLSELSRTAAVVRRRFPNVATPPEATGETVRIRLTDALHELLRAIAEEQPLVVVVDDIHLGDDASVAVLHLLLRRLTSEQILVVGMLRFGEGTLAPSARGLIDRAEIAGLTVIPLPPLSEGESLELLGRLLPDDRPAPPATVRRALLKAGGGLPMLLELLVRDWLGHGDRCVALAVEAMTEEPGAEGGAGATYQRLLERLTLGLEPNTRGVLNLAAILGSQLNEFELYSLVDLTLAQAMAGLSQLATLRILRDSGHGLEFVNEVMRGQVYLSVPSSVRKVLHSKVADRLIARADGGEEMLGLAIAWHCVRSGRVTAAAAWLVRGAREAIARSALAEAEAMLESGRRHLPSHLSGESTVCHAEVLIDQGRYDEACSALSVEPATLGCNPPGRAGELYRIAAAAGCAVRGEDSPRALETLVDLASTACAEEDRLRALNVAVSISSSTLDAQALSTLEALLLGTIASAPPALLPRLQVLYAQLLFTLRRIDSAEAILRDVERNAAPHGPSLHRVHLLSGLGVCLAVRGAYEEALGVTEQAHRLAQRSGALSREYALAGNLALLNFRCGKLSAAVAWSNHALTLLSVVNRGTSLATPLGVAVCCGALNGSTGTWSQHMTTLTEYAHGGGPPALRSAAFLWLADAEWLLGRETDALRDALNGLALHPAGDVISAGQASRWAVAQFQRGRTALPIEMLADAFSRMDRLDAIDRYEVCSSLLMLDDNTIAPHDTLTQLAIAAADKLPAATISYLRRLGLTSPSFSR